MKKVILLLSALLATNFSLFAQSKSVGTGLVDDFAAVTEYGSASDGGIFWFPGETASPYTITRSAGKMAISCVNATEFKPFGLGFGDDNGVLAGGNDFFLDLAKNSNANISITMKNTSLTDSAHVTLQLESIDKKTGSYMPDESAVTTDWGGPRKQKIGFLLLPGETKTSTLNLSLVGKVGGLAAVGFPCTSPLDCPTTAYELDASKVAKLLFFVNGDASLLPAGDRVYPNLTPYDGTLEVTAFSFGTTATKAGLNIDGVTYSVDEVLNLFNNETVTVYNTLGKVVATGKYNELSLEKGQMYILRSASKTQKVILN